MASLKGYEWTFDTAAQNYDKFRPGYVDELYKTIFDYIALNENSHAAEVGIGSGQATLPILKTGCGVTAFEYGEELSELCREKFKEYEDFSVVTGRFEDAQIIADSFDLVYSATAFHWIPEEIGYKKVFSMLKSGGAFARFANHPYRDKGNPALSNEIDKLYAEYYYKYYDKEPKSPVEYSEDTAVQLSDIAAKYGFVDIKHAMFYRTRAFSACEYTALLSTYSDHIAMKEGVRSAFFSKIEQAINDFGGVFTVYDTIDLQLARKP